MIVQDAQNPHSRAKSMGSEGSVVPAGELPPHPQTSAESEPGGSRMIVCIAVLVVWACTAACLGETTRIVDLTLPVWASTRNWSSMSSSLMDRNYPTKPGTRRLLHPQQLHSISVLVLVARWAMERNTSQSAS